MVKIKLPNPNEFRENPKQFFRQLELAVHYAQKSYEEMEKDGSFTSGEDSDNFIVFRFPKLNLYEREDIGEGFVKVHVDEESELDVEIEIA